MSVINIPECISAAGGVSVPLLDRQLASLGGTISADVRDTTVHMQVSLGFPLASIAAPLATAVDAAVARVAGVAQVHTDISWQVRAHAVQGSLASAPNVRNIIAVASGKGGVGKSTTAVNLALALAAEGARVGILDADIYGPSQPMLLGLEGQNPVSTDGKTFEPLEAHGLQAISIGFLVTREQALIWRGPMVTQALQQMMFQTNWRDLDYLVVDLPPGTGDTQLTLTQKVPLSGALIVTTPQDLALLDARRGLKMFEKVNVPVLGIIENMSVHICSQCGHEESLFGAGGGEALAAESGVRLLGQLPLDLGIRTAADSGKPTVAAEPDGEMARRYREVALRAASELALRPLDRKGLFGRISVESA